MGTGIAEPRLDILLVEDNPGDARLVEEALREGRRYNLATVKRLDRCLEHLSERPVDVVLLDLGLPDSQGIDTLKSVLLMRPDIPVVILTGMDDDRTGLLSIQAGAEDYLTKSRLGEFTLSRTISYAIERNQARVAYRRVNGLLRAIRCVNDIILREHDAFLLADSICSELVKLDTFSSAWILLTEANGSLLHAASAGMEPNADPAAVSTLGTELPCLSVQDVEGALSGPSLEGLCGACPLDSFYRKRNPYVNRLYRGGKKRGIIGLCLGSQSAITGEHLSLISEIANDIAFALENIEEESKRERQSELIRLRARILEYSANHGVRDVLRETMAVIAELTGSRSSECYLRDKEAAAFALVAISPPSSPPKACRGDAVDALSADFMNGLAEAGRPLLINMDAGQAPGAPPFDRSLSLSIAASGGTAAVFIFGDKRCAYKEEDAEAAKFISGVALTILQIKESENSIKRSEEKFSVLFQNAADVILMLEDGTPEGWTIRGCNETTVKTLGYPREDLVGRPLAAIEASSSRLRESAGRRGNDGSGHLESISIKTNSGRTLHFECSFSTLDDEPRRMGIMICRDTTERDILERMDRMNARCLEILNDSQSLSSQASRIAQTIREGMGALAAGFRMSDGSGDFPLFSASCAPGYDTTIFPRISESDPCSLVPVRMGEDAQGYLQIAWDGDDAALDGEARELERICRNFALSVARRRADERLKESEARYKAENRFVESMLQASTDIVLVMDALSYDIVRSNDSFRRLAASAGVGAEHTRFLDILAEGSRKRASAAIAKASDTGMAIVPLDLLREDGAIAPFEFSMSPITGETTEKKLLIALGRDMAERLQNEKARKSLEEQLLASQKMEAIGKLAGGVAHDFNNLLAVIIGYAEFALGEAGSNTKLREDIEEINATADRAAALTRQLLAFSRKQVLQPSLVDLNDIAKGIEKMLRRIIGEDIKLELGLFPGKLPIFVDPGQIEQVIMNLAVNARDAMPSGGRLAIGTGATIVEEGKASGLSLPAAGRYSILTVSDTGTGMDDATKARIFEPFFTTKPLGKGTGLGLSVVYGIVRQSGGGIEVESLEGSGTTFRVFLPIEEFVDARKGQVAEKTTVYGGDETIMVVDDEASIRRAVMRGLSEAGYTVLEAHDMPSAMEAMAGHRGTLDCLLTDLVMPGCDGKALASEAKRILPDLKTVYMSGYIEDTSILRAIEEEGADYIQKPFSRAQLTRKIREALDSNAMAANHNVDRRTGRIATERVPPRP